MTLRLHVSADPAALAAEAAARIEAAIAAAIEARGGCSIALAGGSTPRATYQLLAARAIDWSNVQIYFGDERCVPLDDPDSNYLMAQQALLDRVDIPAENVHAAPIWLDDRDQAAELYADALPTHLDVLILGVGEDAHTASLFPGDAALAEQERRVVPVHGPKPPPWRLTITPPVIADAREILVLAAGAGKAAPLREALLGGVDDPSRWPIQLARRGLFLLDHAAAALLGSP